MSSTNVDPDSNPDWSRLDPIDNGELDGTLAPDDLSDPLLDSGSFIDVDLPNGGESVAHQHGHENLNDEKPAEINVELPTSSYPVADENLKPDEPTEEPATPAGKKRRRGSAPATISSEKPDWLPEGWLVEDRVRGSGATAGTKDKYYFDSVSGRRFRSKIEVLYFLENGTTRKKKKPSENSEFDPLSIESGSHKKKSKSAVKISVANFNFHNVPEKIKWILTNPSKGIWTPYKGEEKVPEHTRQEWSAAFYVKRGLKNGPAF